jgi:hypothetical protein
MIAKTRIKGRLHGAFFMCVYMSDKPFDAEACDIGRQASATNGLTDAKNGLSDMKNAPCNRPLKDFRERLTDNTISGTPCC